MFVFSRPGVIGVFAYLDVRCSMLESSLTWTFIFFHDWLSGHHKKFLVLFAQDLIVAPYSLLPTLPPPIPYPSTDV